MFYASAIISSLTAARRWMLAGIVAGVALCLACCGAVVYGLL